MKNIRMRLLKKIVKTQRRHRFVILNEHPFCLASCIYAVNHSCKWDTSYLIELLPRNFYILAGKQRLKLTDRIGVILNGTVWVDRKSKKSRNAVKEKLKRLLGRGKNILIFPEGTWNLTPSTPVLPLYWGIIEIAQYMNVPVVPMCLEYRADECFVKYGEPIYIAKECDKDRQIQELRDVFATLKWDIWDMFSVEKRSEIADDYWEREVTKRLNEYKLLDYEYEMSCVRK